MANDWAIDLTGVVTAVDAPVPAPFSSASVGDQVYVHYSVAGPPDLSTPFVSTYGLDTSRCSISIGGVNSPISANPYLPGEPPVRLIDGTQDGLVIHVRMPGNGSWFSTALSDPSGTLIADREISNMQGHTVGAIPGMTGGMYFVTLAAFEIEIQVNQVSFGREGSFGNGFYCFGDGSGTACPCANVGAPGQGCANSTLAGAQLFSFGSASVSNDTLEFVSIQQPPQGIGLLLTGTLALNSGVAVGDGLLCVGGSTQRLTVLSSDVNGTTVWGPGLLGQMGASPGQLHHFQSWYRDPMGSPCGAGFNFSNGVSLFVTN